MLKMKDSKGQVVGVLKDEDTEPTINKAKEETDSKDEKTQRKDSE